MLGSPFLRFRRLIQITSWSNKKSSRKLWQFLAHFVKSNHDTLFLDAIPGALAVCVCFERDKSTLAVSPWRAWIGFRISPASHTSPPNPREPVAGGLVRRWGQHQPQRL